ncbi:hypothetical protein CVD25_08310 [Bacillus canaveralius]|uniref:Phenylalanyl-tRNA synthetase subunit beta n=1 Tax=Bacillus canaveralius TaxID=1403243 RepID=A0A2N5GIJ5_9BACI|nr:MULTISPECIES: hypothetical protein [Bacillus]PLR80761.1 hypothetical protein CU635_17060 [Bacillus canaveralius]PLR81751.1 hypothetical protein CVD23_18430 [Bacillus sp. V33-4]PLR98361.1 hypothetical protein CVD25_08310 [Bacillus canaveralius]RSK52919.1 hypothetical protein EJA13_09655 [Bacillus canaveralius]
MKKLILLLLIVGGLGTAGFLGYNAFMGMASDKVMEQVANSISEEDVNQLVQDPSIQQLIGENADLANIDTSNLPFSTKEEALKTITKEFSVKEITDITSTISDGITADEQTELLETVQSRLTEEELAALKIIAVKEALKNQ